MNEIAELSKGLEKVCDSIDQLINTDEHYNNEMSIYLEQMAQDIYMTAQNMKFIREYFRVGN